MALGGRPGHPNVFTMTPLYNNHYFASVQSPYLVEYLIKWVEINNHLSINATMTWKRTKVLLRWQLQEPSTQNSTLTILLLTTMMPGTAPMSMLKTSSTRQRSTMLCKSIGLTQLRWRQWKKNWQKLGVQTLVKNNWKCQCKATSTT